MVPQNEQNCILLGQRKNQISKSVSSFLALNINLRRRRPKPRFKNIFSEAMCQLKKQYLKVNFWNWVPKTIWHKTAGVQFFSLKSLHPTVKYCMTYVSVRKFPHLQQRDIECVFFLTYNICF